MGTVITGFVFFKLIKKSLYAQLYIVGYVYVNAAQIGLLEMMISCLLTNLISKELFR